jgi:cytochrome c biogenesis protein CcmG/thiol:disulfide interchange protein DsbE
MRISLVCLRHLSVIIFILLVSTGCEHPAVIQNAPLPPGSPASAITPKPARLVTPAGGTPPAIPGVPVANVQEAPAKGFRAPDFTLTEVRTNKQITLSTLRGKPVFLNFWATWCPPCKEEMPMIENLYAKDKGQIEFMGITSSSSGDLQQVTSFINASKFSWTFLYDPSDSVGSTYQAVSYPTSYFIDRNGLIRAIQIGEMDQATIEANLQSIR